MTTTHTTTTRRGHRVVKEATGASNRAPRLRFVQPLRLSMRGAAGRHLDPRANRGAGAVLAADPSRREESAAWAPRQLEDASVAWSQAQDEGADREVGQVEEPGFQLTVVNSGLRPEVDFHALAADLGPDVRGAAAIRLNQIEHTFHRPSEERRPRARGADAGFPRAA